MRLELAVAVVLGVALLAAGSVARAEPRTRFSIVLDPDLHMEPGVLSTESLGRLLFHYDDHLARFTSIDEETIAGRALAIGGRAAKLVLVDVPIAGLTTTMLHEVFGHGARAREQGLDPTYSFQLPSPYDALFGVEQTFHAFTYYGTTGSADRDLAMTIGGIESNDLAAVKALERMNAEGGRHHYGDGLLYLFDTLTYGEVFLSDFSAPNADDGDVNNYVTGLQRRFNRPEAADRSAIADRVRAAYLWTFADPTLWVALYETLVGHVYQGRRWFELPRPELAGLAFWAAARFVPSPLGAEHYLHLFAASDTWSSSVHVRWASTGLAPDLGVGAKVARLELFDALELGVEADAWLQPAWLPERRNLFDRPLRAGANLALEVAWPISDRWHLLAKLAAKTPGYLLGAPLDAALYGHAGIGLDLGAE